MAKVFEGLQCRILDSCVSVMFFFFVIAKRDGFALFVHFADHILITQDSAKHKVLYSHSNFHSKVQRHVAL